MRDDTDESQYSEVLMAPRVFTEFKPKHTSAALADVIKNEQFVLLYPHLLSPAQQAELAVFLDGVEKSGKEGVAVLGGPQNPPPPTV